MSTVEPNDFVSTNIDATDRRLVLVDAVSNSDKGSID